MERKNMMHLLHEARGCLGSYDDFPVMPIGTDPMPCLSWNHVAQPFYLVSEHDQALLTLAGQARLELVGASPDVMPLELGDMVYIPAGLPSRIVPLTPTVQVKYKASPPGWEAAAWYCPSCRTELFRREFDATEILPQDGYWQACQEFNADAAARTCVQCGAVHPPADLSGIRWPEVAEQIRASDRAKAQS
jgi:hypothetical protein